MPRRGSARPRRGAGRSTASPGQTSEALACAERTLAFLAGFPGRKVVTGFGNAGERFLSFNFDMEDGQVTSTTRQHALSMLARVHDVGGLTVRQFTNEADPSGAMCPDHRTPIPIKNIYGLVITDGQVRRLSPEENREVQCTCAATGLPLDPEPAVRYL